MNNFNQQKQRSHQLFLDALEQEETAYDVPKSEIETGETAYRAYKEGRDPGKSLAELKAELG